MILQAASDWFYPQGVQDLLLYTKNEYKGPVIYRKQENLQWPSTVFRSICIRFKLDFYRKVKKHFIEGEDGYTVRFGIIYVNCKDGLRTDPKASAKWFNKFLHQWGTTKHTNRKIKPRVQISSFQDLKSLIKDSKCCSCISTLICTLI